MATFKIFQTTILDVFGDDPDSILYVLSKLSPKWSPYVYLLSMALMG
jgi:hypothetical protein